MRYAIVNATMQQVRSVGGTDIKEARRTGIIFAMLSELQVDRLKIMGCQVTKVGGVKATIMPPIVTPPMPVEAVPTYSPEELVWAAGYEELRGLTEPPLYGEGMNLAVIDSGIRETHEKLAGRVIYSKNYTSDKMEDGFNHGTSVCSIIVAVAPLCNILNLKVLDSKGSGTEEDVILAIDECIDLHDTNPNIAPSVINLSLGAPDDGNPLSPMRVACRVAIERGIWIIASAGNDGPNPQTITSPACEKYVFAIGSLKYDPFAVSIWSSRGPTKQGLSKPDAVFFGEDIIMASSVSDTATIAKSGTSFAAPFASGSALLYLEGMYKRAIITQPITGVYPEITELVSVEEAMNVYLSGICIKPEGVAIGKDYDYGYGLPFGPLVAQAMMIKPAVDISTLLSSVMPILTIGILGMIIIPMTKGLE